MKKFISNLKNNSIEHIIISGFSPTEIGFTEGNQRFDDEKVSLIVDGKIVFCHLKSDSLEMEKQLVRTFIDNEMKSFTFIGKGKSLVESDVDGFVIMDHVNMSGKNPLRGSNDENYGVRFPDMSATYKNDFMEEKLTQLNLKISKLLIPKNIDFLSEIEQTVIKNYKDLEVLSEETFYGVITAKHAGISVNSIILKIPKKINSLFT